MLVVLAGRTDAAARALVTRWSASDAHLMTCADLSHAGWRVRTGLTDAAVAVVDGQLMPVKAIDGVLVRLPCVGEAELTHVAAADRGYVASEMHAFLTWWLWTLVCPVLNRPTRGGFASPALSPLEWVTLARQLAIPVRAQRRCAAMGDLVEPNIEPTVTVSVIGGRCFGPDDDALRGRARRIAAEVDAQVLAVRFDNDGLLVDAHPWVNVWDPEIDDALLRCFAEGAAC